MNNFSISEEFLNNIINTVADPIFVKDEKHRWIILNDAFCNFMGYSREELVGKSDPDFFPKEESEIFWKYDDLIFETGITNINEEFFTDAQGNTHIISTKKSAFTDSKTGNKILVGVIRDITDIKKAEESLRASKEMLQLVIDNIPQHIFWKDINSTFLGCNRIFAKTTGLAEPKDIIGKNNHDLFGKEEADEYRKDDLNVMNTDTPYFHRIETAIDHDSKQLYLDATKIPIHDIHGKVIGLLATYEDITERKRLEEELIKARKFETLAILAGGLSHDFNNLLSIIIGNISTARMFLDEKKNIGELLHRAENASNKAKELILKIITFSKAEEPKKRIISIKELLIKSTLFALENNDVKSDFFISDDLWPVEADENLLNLVIYNILENAMESMKKNGKVKIYGQNVEIDEFLNLKKGNYIKIAIEDNGVGIGEENIDKIFDPYYTTKQYFNEKGTGLGLTICYSIIKKHDGLITVKSEKGKGTTFSIYLPAVRSE